MVDIFVAKVKSGKERTAFVEMMCEENHYDSEKKDGETKAEFADRLFQEALDARLTEEAKEDWMHIYDLAFALWEDEYQTDNPPPAGVHIDPPNAKILAEAKGG